MSAPCATRSVLARAVGVPVGRRSAGRQATTLVATKNVIIYFFSFFFPFFFFSVATFSHRRSAGIKIFSESCSERPITSSAILEPPGGHFGFCRWCGDAPGAARLVFDLTFIYLQLFSDFIKQILTDAS